MTCFQRVVLGEVDSTNAEALRRADAGEMGPIWIAAHRQTSGRGRQGRPWSTETGNLAATLLLSYANRGSGWIADIGMLTAVAVGEAVAELAPGRKVALKWPNDVLLDGGKVSGILIENVAEAAPGLGHMAIGMGINLAHCPSPEHVRWKPTCIADVSGGAPTLERALDVLAERTESWLKRLDAHGRTSLLEAWRTRLTGIGQTIEVRLPAETLSGEFRAVDEDGRMILATSAGDRRISAADIYLPGPA